MGGPLIPCEAWLVGAKEGPSKTAVVAGEIEVGSGKPGTPTVQAVSLMIYHAENKLTEPVFVIEADVAREFAASIIAIADQIQGVTTPTTAEPVPLVWTMPASSDD